MKKKEKMFPGFVVLILTAIITLAGCNNPQPPNFPSEFRGTWERIDQPESYTLIFIDTSLKDSSQDYWWELKDVSGNEYTIKSVNIWNSTVTICIWIENGNLNISGDDSYHSWNGEWRKQ
jgi:hypothetical protein